MFDKTIKESTLRNIVKVLLEDKNLGPALINVNPVVDPSAALTDPSNPNYVPDSSIELKVALGTIASEVPQQNIPKVYKTIRQALDAAAEAEKVEEKGNSSMKKDVTSVEETVRNLVKKVLEENLVSEALPVPPPRMKLPEKVPAELDPEEMLKQKGLTAAQKKELQSKIMHSKPVSNPAGVTPTKYEPGVSGAKTSAENPFAASDKDVKNIDSLDKSTETSPEEKKNVTCLIFLKIFGYLIGQNLLVT